VFASADQSIISRVEYRRGWSDQPYFQVGQTLNDSKHQKLLVAGFVFVVKPGMLDFRGKA